MSSDLKPGSLLFNRWKIIEFLGEGTLGKVYRADDLEMKRDVAIKQLRPELAFDNEALERFRNELRTISSLNDQYIITIYDFKRDPESGDCFSIMEYVESNLRDYMREKGALPVAEALRIAIAICKSLAKVHWRGIVHNDLKPANILLDGEGDNVIPKISDFGSRYTAYTSDEHKYLYASPEELKHGNDKSVRTYIWSDLYSMGAILYEMLTGQVPFPFTDRRDDVSSADTYQQPIRPSHRQAYISRAIDSVVLQALQKDPAARYRTASDMAEALEQALEKWEAELEKLHATAKDRLNQEEWSKAAELYKDILEKNPDDQGAKKALEYAQGMSDLSEKKWEQAAKRLSVVEDPQYLYAAEGLRLARRLEAAGLYAKALKLESKEEWPQVIEVLNKIIEIDGGYKDAAQRLMAEVRKQSEWQHSYEEAEELLREERWVEAAAKLEEIAKKAGEEYKEVIPKLEKARRQEKLRKRYDNGMARFENKDWPSAVADLKEVVQLNPAYQEVCIKLAQAEREQLLESFYSQGIAHFEKREWKKAIESLDEVVRLAPEYNEDAAIKLAEARKFDLYDEAVVYLQRKEWQQAIEKLEEVSLMDPGYSDVAVKLKGARTRLKLESLWAEAVKQEDANQWRKAIETYFQIQELALTDGIVSARLDAAIRNNRLQLLYCKGKTLLASKKWQEAFYKFKEVVDTNSSFEDARKSLEEARAGYLSSLYIQAREHEKKGEWEKVIQICTEILEIDPGYRNVPSLLRRAKRGPTLPIERRGGLKELTPLYKTLVTIVVEALMGIVIASYFRVDTFEGLLLVFGILLMGLGILLYFILRQETSSNV
jgi:serine/threonine protein kinase